MGLTGEKKKEYQKRYMQKRRGLTEGSNNGGSNGEGLTELPPEIVNSINDLVEHRLEMGLPDDREVRLVRALEYHRWNEQRLAERMEYMRNHPRKELQAVS